MNKTSQIALAVSGIALLYLLREKVKEAGAVSGDPKLSEHFALSEAAVTSYDQYKAQNLAGAYENLDAIKGVARFILEPIREAVSAPMYISSWFRSPALNSAVKGSPYSQHLTGEAVDFNVKGYNSDEGRMKIIKIINEMRGLSFGQLLLEPNVIHISAGEKREIASYDKMTGEKIPLFV